MLFALNFVLPHHEELLVSRQKNATIRPGDIKDTYPENSVVWVTVGKKFGPKKKLYPAMIDKSYVKRFSELSSNDLAHQNPEIQSVDELMGLFEKIYERQFEPDDLVTIIYFSEVIPE